jgi:hypothetical protein
MSESYLDTNAPQPLRTLFKWLSENFDTIDNQEDTSTGKCLYPVRLGGAASKLEKGFLGIVQSGRGELPSNGFLAAGPFSENVFGLTF